MPARGIALCGYRWFWRPWRRSRVGWRVFLSEVEKAGLVPGRLYRFGV